MRPFAFRRALGGLMLVALAGATAGCRQAEQGALEVVVIGETAGLSDPRAGPLAPGDALLLANVAQGLVRFDARGQIEPGLAERWNVSDDGLSYIFRLAAGQWSGGGRITAEQVARALRRQIAASSRNELRDSLGAVDEIIAMTDRVLEIRLKAPRPHLLQLLAQPELALLYGGQGGGPFALDASKEDGLRLTRLVAVPDEELERRDELLLRAATAAEAVRSFAGGTADLVLGGTFAELPLARRVPDAARGLVFDPVSGLFGLAATRADGPLADPEVRRLLSQAIDRAAFLAALDVPGLVPRVTVLEIGLDDVAAPAVPAWAAVPFGDRRPELILAADRLFGSAERPTLRIALPDGPGAEMLLRRLAADWGLLGISVERAKTRASADLVLIDAVAPSTSPAWFLRHFRCAEERPCEPEIDALLESARAAPVAAQRGALLADAARRIDDLHYFLPIAAPIRWSLVSERVQGFAGNRFARHTLTGLSEKLTREGAD